MIIRSKAPLRLGLAGGGSDVSPYSDTYGGLILNATINLYAYCTIEETGDNLITIKGYDSDCFKSFLKSAILKIDGEASLIKGVYNRIQKEYPFETNGFKITTSLPLGDYEISRLAYEIERKELGLSGGKQDQYAAAFGGFNYMEFLQNDMVVVNPLKVKRWIVDELEASMLLYFTGRSRSSAAIIDEQKKNTVEGNIDAIEAMHRIKQSAVDMKLAVLKGDMVSFANILGKAWEDKKKMAGAISNPMIQEAFNVAAAAGAKAGKVSGAGGGGFIMFFVEPTRKKEVINALSKLNGFVMPFNFTEGGAHGWKIYPTDKVSTLSR